MTESLTQFTITEVATGYWKVTSSNPPVNLCDPDTLLELRRVVDLIESNETLQVVVFDSADPDFFINHFDVSKVADFPLVPGPTFPPTFIDTTIRLGRLPGGHHRLHPGDSGRRI
ncbi:enoyl-CoA hydratase/carnithine racemase [Rhodococcus sp. OAS809]|uniref:hypothetical protein n=1 Tax=Rhodococcus sp. OAS809 TaxID=2663874 RepID=UPI001A0716FC